MNLTLWSTCTTLLCAGYVRGDAARWTDPPHTHFVSAGKEAGLGPSSEVNNPTAQVQWTLEKKIRVGLRKNTKSAAHDQEDWGAWVHGRTNPLAMITQIHQEGPQFIKPCCPKYDFSGPHKMSTLELLGPEGVSLHIFVFKKLTQIFLW